MDARHEAGMTGRGRAPLFDIACSTCAASPALAHTGSVSGGFAGGLSHPLFGPDHVAAMVAVGLWGAFLGPPAIYILPVVFPLVMAFGGVLGILGVPLPGVEIGIAVSAAVLGMMVALAARPPLVGRRRHRRRVRDLPRPCAWRRASARRRCARLFGRLRHRHRLSASLRHRLRPVGALACGTDRGAHRRRRDCHRRADVSRPARMKFIARRCRRGIAFVARPRRHRPIRCSASRLRRRIAASALVPAHVMAVVALALLIGQQAAGADGAGCRLCRCNAGGPRRDCAWLTCRRGRKRACSVLAASARCCWWRWRGRCRDRWACCSAAATGLALALDSPPEAISLREANLTLLGTALGAVHRAAGFAAGDVAPATRAGSASARASSGSWIAASAILVLALRLVG